MPFFQGAYNFEIHGGSFGDSARHHRHHHHQSTGGSRTSTFSLPSRRQSPQRTTSLPTHLPPPLLNSGSVDSDKTLDEEAQVALDAPGRLSSFCISLTDTLPRQVYMHLLLKLPSHYFGRVDRLAREANLALKEILDMAVRAECKGGWEFQNEILDLGRDASPLATDFKSLPPSYQQLTLRWGCFIDSLIEEWKTLNLVSALLVP